MPVAPHDPGDEPADGHDLPLLFNLVYCSRAAASVDDAAVDRIVDASQRHNPRRGITGLLVFGGGIFFQWLEGPRDSVLQLMETLRQDSRHDTVIQLSETEEVRERLFPEWSMERVAVDDIRAVLTDARDTADDPRNEHALQLLVEQLDAGGLSGLTRT